MLASTLRRSMQKASFIASHSKNATLLNAIRMTQRPAAQVAHQSVIGQHQATRGFASFELIERSTQKLTKALDSEIKYESENYTQLEDIETFLNESGFQFSETDDGLELSLTKEIGDKKIEVIFEAR